VNRRRDPAGGEAQHARPGRVVLVAARGDQLGLAKKSASGGAGCGSGGGEGTSRLGEEAGERLVSGGGQKGRDA
jgi:hypothetical protein